MQNTRTKDSDLYRCNFNIPMIRKKEETKKSAKCHVAALEEEKKKKDGGAKSWSLMKITIIEENL